MAYAILRCEKLKTAGKAGGLNRHLERTMHVPNADPELARYNHRLVGSGELVADIEARIQSAGVRVRPDSVRAVEFLMTASPEHFDFHKTQQEGKTQLTGQVENWNAFQAQSVAWLTQCYGRENVVSITAHLDEQTPHLHAVIVPIYHKDGQAHLSAKEVIGGPLKLREMQTSFAQVHAAQGLQRGVEGSKAHHQDVASYYHQVQEFKRGQGIAPVAVHLPTPQIVVEAPEKDFLGRMVEKPDEYAQRQQRRLESEIRVFQSQESVRLGKEVGEKMQQARLATALQQENRQLKGQVLGLRRQVEQVQREKTRGRELLDAVATGRVKPEELAKAQNQRPTNEREQAISEALRGAGVDVQSPELKHSRGQGHGMGM